MCGDRGICSNKFRIEAPRTGRGEGRSRVHGSGPGREAAASRASSAQVRRQPLEPPVRGPAAGRLDPTQSTPRAGGAERPPRAASLCERLPRPRGDPTFPGGGAQLPAARSGPAGPRPPGETRLSAGGGALPALTPHAAPRPPRLPRSGATAAFSEVEYYKHGAPRARSPSRGAGGGVRAGGAGEEGGGRQGGGGGGLSVTPAPRARRRLRPERRRAAGRRRHRRGGPGAAAAAVEEPEHNGGESSAAGRAGASVEMARPAWWSLPGRGLWGGGGTSEC